MLYKLAAAFDKFQPSCWETGGSVADGSEQNLQIVLENLFALFFCTDRSNGGETPTVFFVRQEFVFQLNESIKVNLENPNKQRNPQKTFSKFHIFRIVDKTSEGSLLPVLFAARATRRSDGVASVLER